LKVQSCQFISLDTIGKDQRPKHQSTKGQSTKALKQGYGDWRDIANWNLETETELKKGYKKNENKKSISITLFRTSFIDYKP
jgi:hypothetical protein